MSTVMNGNGSIPSATTGAQTRVAIVSSTHATPIVVTTGTHGFNTGDTVEIEGHATNTAANAVWQITVQSPTTFVLNGSVGNGVGGATGYAIDYEIQPAYTLPSPGQAASMVDVGPVLEGLSNTTPYLYRRIGKWRLYNQFELFAGDTLTQPYLSNPWSTTAGITSGTFALLNSAQFSLESMSDTTSLPSYSGSNELFQFSVSFTARIVPTGSANNYAYMNIGAGIASGTGAPSMLEGPFCELVGYCDNSGNVIPNAWPVTLAGSFVGSFDASNLYLSLVARADSIFAGSASILLLGPITGYVNQYRQN